MARQYGYYNPTTGTLTPAVEPPTHSDIPYAQLCPDIITVNTGDIEWSIKNLFDMDLTPQNIVNMGVDCTKIANGFTITPDAAHPGGNGYITFRLPMSDDNANVWGKTVTMSFRVANSVSGAVASIRLGYWKATSYTFATLQEVYGPSDGEHHFTFTFPATPPSDYIQFPDAWGRSGINIFINPHAQSDARNVCTITDIQVEYGSSVTPYEPHSPAIRTHGSHKLTVTKDGTTVTEYDIPMLLSDNSFVDIQPDSNNKSEAWAIKVFDGTENWQKTSGGNNAYYAIISGMKVCNPPENGLSSHFTGTNEATASMPDYSIKNTYAIEASGQVGAIAIKVNSITTVNDFKAYLAAEYAAGHPVIILYPLSTPAVSTVAEATVSLTSKSTYTAVSQAEIPSTTQATYLGK